MKRSVPSRSRPLSSSPVLLYLASLQANEKNVRISALEENEIKVFLISASPKDAEKIYKALEYRSVVSSGKFSYKSSLAKFQD